MRCVLKEKGARGQSFIDSWRATLTLSKKKNTRSAYQNRQGHVLIVVRTERREKTVKKQVLRWKRSERSRPLYLLLFISPPFFQFKVAKEKGRPPLSSRLITSIVFNDFGCRSCVSIVFSPPSELTEKYDAGQGGGWELFFFFLYSLGLDFCVSIYSGALSWASISQNRTMCFKIELVNIVVCE